MVILKAEIKVVRKNINIIGSAKHFDGVFKELFSFTFYIIINLKEL